MGTFSVPIQIGPLSGGRAEAVEALVVFGDAESAPLLGVFTLEGFGLAADPVNHRLVSVPGLLKRAG